MLSKAIIYRLVYWKYLKCHHLNTIEDLHISCQESCFTWYSDDCSYVGICPVVISQWRFLLFLCPHTIFFFQQRDVIWFPQYHHRPHSDRLAAMNRDHEKCPGEVKMDSSNLEMREALHMISICRPVISCWHFWWVSLTFKIRRLACTSSLTGAHFSWILSIVNNGHPNISEFSKHLFCPVFMVMDYLLTLSALDINSICVHRLKKGVPFFLLFPTANIWKPDSPPLYLMIRY